MAGAMETRAAPPKGPPRRTAARHDRREPRHAPAPGAAVREDLDRCPVGVPGDRARPVNDRWTAGVDRDGTGRIGSALVAGVRRGTPRDGLQRVDGHPWRGLLRRPPDTRTRD